MAALVVAGLPAGAAAATAPHAGAPAVSAAVTLRSTAGCAGGRSLAARRSAVACLVNRARAGAGLSGFRGHRALALAAGRHARAMARGRFFAHQRAGGPSLTARARAAGWRGRRLGEAIAYACGSAARPAAIVQAWLNSPPHRAILLSTRLRRVGIGVARRAPVSCRGGRTFVLDAGS